tara:strand:+ start:195390 stop:195491 length:102 start_codon:yes stop_codon:yes gene_type:complete
VKKEVVAILATLGMAALIKTKSCTITGTSTTMN